MSIDIDAKDNPGLKMNDLKAELSTIDEVAYCGRSVSGSGLWLLVPISRPDMHAYHFKAWSKFLLSMGVVVDESGSNVNRLRFYAHDPDAYFNNNAGVFCLTYQDPPRYNPKPAAGEEYIDPIEILDKYGFTRENENEDFVRYCGPHKDKGTSVSLHKGTMKLRVFTSSIPDLIPERAESYTLLEWYAWLEHGGDIKAARKALRNLKNAAAAATF